MEERGEKKKHEVMGKVVEDDGTMDMDELESAQVLQERELEDSEYEYDSCGEELSCWPGNALDRVVEPHDLGVSDDENVAPSYYDWKVLWPELEKFLDNFNVLKREMEELTRTSWIPWPEHTLYQGKGNDGKEREWKVIPFVYTFPAYDPSSTKWVDNNCKACPKTFELLKSIPNIRTALYSRLGPGVELSAHQGWSDLANHVLRCHIPLAVPEPEEDKCGLWVEGLISFHKPGSIIIFDDSKWHKAFNRTHKDRIVLIIDIMRPNNIPIGSAEGGHTAQLDEFIAQFQAL